MGGRELGLNIGDEYEIALIEGNNIRAIYVCMGYADNRCVHKFVSRKPGSDRLLCFRMYDGCFSVHESLINPLPAKNGQSFDVFVYDGDRDENIEGLGRKIRSTVIGFMESRGF